MSVDKRQIERMLALDQTDTLSDGEPGLRFTAHYAGRPSSRDRALWAQQLRTWQRRLAADLKDVGVEQVEGSLSLSGQTVELVVPLKRLEDILKTLDDRGIDVVLLREHGIDPEP